MKKEIAKRDGNAFKTNEVNVKHDYIDARYELFHYPRNEITTSGLLIVGEQKSSITGSVEKEEGE